MELYFAIKNAIPVVAKYAKPYLQAITYISCIHIFIRMVFISVTDIAEVRKAESLAENSNKWPGLLLGQFLSESLSSFCMLFSIFLIYRIEKIAEAYYLH